MIRARGPGERGWIDLGREDVTVTQLTTHRHGRKPIRALVLTVNIAGVRVQVQPKDLDRFAAEVIEARDWVAGEGDR